MRVMSWYGFEDYKKTGWHRKSHIHQVPFYYVEYGLAQLGAVQVWGNALKDQAKAVADYRYALSLGATRPCRSYSRRPVLNWHLMWIR